MQKKKILSFYQRSFLVKIFVRNIFLTRLFFSISIHQSLNDNLSFHYYFSPLIFLKEISVEFDCLSNLISRLIVRIDELTIVTSDHWRRSTRHQMFEQLATSGSVIFGFKRSYNLHTEFTAIYTFTGKIETRRRIGSPTVATQQRLNSVHLRFIIGYTQLLLPPLYRYIIRYWYANKSRWDTMKNTLDTRVQSSNFYFKSNSPAFQNIV